MPTRYSVDGVNRTVRGSNLQFSVSVLDWLGVGEAGDIYRGHEGSDIAELGMKWDLSFLAPNRSCSIQDYDISNTVYDRLNAPLTKHHLPKTRFPSPLRPRHEHDTAQFPALSYI